MLHRSLLYQSAQHHLRLPNSLAATGKVAMSTSVTSNFKNYSFGPWPINSSEIFATSPLSFAFVNLKPVVPGHVLISPKRVVHRFADLSSEEISDLWTLSQRVGTAIEKHYTASSLTLTIQDGPEAGQTVPHVHVHVLPRKVGDFEKNDEIYDVIDESEKELASELELLGKKEAEKLDLDIERKPRTPEEMAEEATTLRALFI